MGKDMSIFKDKLTVIEQKLRTFQNKYPRHFTFYVGEEQQFPEEHPTFEECEEIDELRKERKKLVDKLDAQTN